MHWDAGRFKKGQKNFVTSFILYWIGRSDSYRCFVFCHKKMSRNLIEPSEGPNQAWGAKRVRSEFWPKLVRLGYIFLLGFILQKKKRFYFLHNLFKSAKITCLSQRLLLKWPRVTTAHLGPLIYNHKLQLGHLMSGIGQLKGNRK